MLALLVQSGTQVFHLIHGLLGSGGRSSSAAVAAGGGDGGSSLYAGGRMESTSLNTIEVRGKHLRDYM